MCADVSAENGLEIEVKLAVTDPQSLLERLGPLSFVCTTPRTHEFNLVFDRNGEELARGNILLRLRRWGGRHILTVKSPPDPQSVPMGYKVRREVEIEVDDFNKTVQIFNTLGYHRSFAYEKYRTEFRSPDGLILTLDETPVGCFAELEGTPERIDLYMSQLGYRREQAICHNYRSIFLNMGGSGDMLFK